MAGNRNSARLKTKKTNCMSCNGKIDSSTPALMCDNCLNWVCQPCSKVPLTLYNELVKFDDDSSPDWNCKTCKSTKADLKGIHKTLLEMKKDNDSRLKSVEDGLANIAASVKSTVREEVDKVKDTITESVKDNIATQVKAIVNAQYKEMKERENRANNIVIFNLNMSSSKVPQERKEHDISIIRKLFAALCPDQDDLEIKACFRLLNRKKQKADDAKKTPPIKLALRLKEQRRQFLLNSKNISTLEDDTLKGLIIARDLTIEQRQDYADLMKEKETREKNGEKLEVRNGKLVPARSRSQQPDFRIE